MMLREDIEQHTNEQKDRELKKNNHPADQKREAAIALVSRGEQSLHDGLIRTMTRHHDERSADQTRPERVLRRQAKGKIENLQFVSGAGRNLRDFAPSSRDAMEQDHKSDHASGQIQQQLGNVGPDDRLHAAFKGVK